MKRTTVCLLMGLIASAPALAHHSFAMFNRTKEVLLDCTVKDWQFTNPHSYLDVTVLAAGKSIEYSLETGGVEQLLRQGLRQHTYSPGDHVQVIMHPLRNGSSGGELVAVKSSDGVVRSFYKDRVPGGPVLKPGPPAS